MQCSVSDNVGVITMGSYFKSEPESPSESVEVLSNLLATLQTCWRYNSHTWSNQTGTPQDHASTVTNIESASDVLSGLVGSQSDFKHQLVLFHQPTISDIRLTLLGVAVTMLVFIIVWS